MTEHAERTTCWGAWLVHARRAWVPLAPRTNSATTLRPFIRRVFFLFRLVLAAVPAGAWGAWVGGRAAAPSEKPRVAATSRPTWDLRSFRDRTTRRRRKRPIRCLLFFAFLLFAQHGVNRQGALAARKASKPTPSFSSPLTRCIVCAATQPKNNEPQGVVRTQGDG
jgi:hypothetical protein